MIPLVYPTTHQAEKLHLSFPPFPQQEDKNFHLISLGCTFPPFLTVKTCFVFCSSHPVMCATAVSYTIAFFFLLIKKEAAQQKMSF